MSDLWTVVFFPRTKTVDVLPATDVHGEATVGEIRKVTWNERAYNAKIVFVGQHEECERMVPLVSSDGIIISPPFEIDQRTLSPSTTPESTCTCCNVCRQNNEMKMKEVLDRLKHLELNTASKTFERNTERSIEKLSTNLEEMNVVLRRVYAQMPRPVIEGPNFSIMDQQEVAKIRQLKGNNVRKFALELERKLYQNEPQERDKDVESRLNSADKVQFLKECVFMFYNINDEGARTLTWTSVRNAINSRARKLRSRGPSDVNRVDSGESNVGNDPFRFADE